MPGKAQPLPNTQPIVDAQGCPTQYFMRWAQERQKNITDGENADGVNDLIAAWAAARTITAGAGLAGGGSLAEDRTISLADTAVVPGPYGDATHVGKFTVDEHGRITEAENVAITTISEAPLDGKYYCRQNGAWVAFTPQSVP